MAVLSLADALLGTQWVRVGDKTPPMQNAQVALAWDSKLRRLLQICASEGYLTAWQLKAAGWELITERTVKQVIAIAAAHAQGVVEVLTVVIESDGTNALKAFQLRESALEPATIAGPIPDLEHFYRLRLVSLKEGELLCGLYETLHRVDENRRFQAVDMDGPILDLCPDPTGQLLFVTVGGVFSADGQAILTDEDDLVYPDRLASDGSAVYAFSKSDWSSEPVYCIRGNTARPMPFQAPAGQIEDLAYDPIQNHIVAVVDDGERIQTWTFSAARGFGCLDDGGPVSPEFIAGVHLYAIDERTSAIYRYEQGRCHRIVDGFDGLQHELGRTYSATPSVDGRLLIFDTHGAVHAVTPAGESEPIVSASDGPGPREGAMIAQLDSGFYLFGGKDQRGKSKNDLWRHRGRWEQLEIQPSPKRRANATVVTVGSGRWFLMWGGGGIDTRSVWSFDGVAWTRHADLEPSYRTLFATYYPSTDQILEITQHREGGRVLRTWDGTGFRELGPIPDCDETTAFAGRFNLLFVAIDPVSQKLVAQHSGPVTWIYELT